MVNSIVLFMFLTVITANVERMKSKGIRKYVTILRENANRKQYTTHITETLLFYTLCYKPFIIN
jgi:hypothetical protein